VPTTKALKRRVGGDNPRDVQHRQRIEVVEMATTVATPIGVTVDAAPVGVTPATSRR
jgi:hypothetical protein